MPLRLLCPRISLSRSGLLHPYWGGQGLPRPRVDLFVIGPGGTFLIEPVQIDTAADYTLLASRLATGLKFPLPFSRQAQVSGAGGSWTSIVSFPPDGLVSLFVTDYREYAYLPRPLVGFHAAGRSAPVQRSVLGLTGFLQHFQFVLDLPATPPTFILEAGAGFPGSVGILPLNRSLADFIASLRGSV